MTIHYIDFANGNDTTGTGATGAPWKTLGGALGKVAVVNGDTIRLRGGNVAGQHYYERNLSTTKTTLTIEPDTGHTPVFRGSTLKTSWAKTGGQTNVYESADTEANCFGVWNGAQSLTSTASIAACDALTNSFFFDGTGDKLYVNIGGSAPTSIDKIPTAQAFLTVTGAGLTIDGLTYEYSLQGIDLQAAPVVRNCLFRRFSNNATSRFAINLDGNGAVVENCTIEFFRAVNANQGIIVEATASNVAISDCEITGGYRSINIVGGSGHTIDRCNLWSAYQDSVQSTGTATIRDCVATDANHIGFQSRGGTNTFIRCVFYINPGNPNASTGLFGFVAELSGTSANFYHCACVNLDRGSDSDPAAFYITTIGAGVVNIKNCIAYNSGAGIRWDGSGTLTNDYNGFFGNVDNYEASAVPGANDIIADPLFTDQANDVYTLTALSPYINEGVVVAGVNDGAGYPDGLPDIGAYEFVAAGGEPLILMMQQLSIAGGAL